MSPLNPDVAQALQRNSEPQSACLDTDKARPLLAERPNLLADCQVFLATSWYQAMADAVAALERVIALPGWQAQVLASAGETARHPTAAKGVFYGYDFHITDQGPRLIEINTNAGGGFINVALIRSQASPQGLPDPAEVDAAFVAMFRREWALSGKTSPLQRVANVDENPGEQYLHPDFEYCRQLLQAAGIEAVIFDPAELQYVDGRLIWTGQGNLPIDLVYNRLTDFSLAQPNQQALRSAWLDDAVVLTPHPRAHALYADKHNLVRLSDASWLQSIGATAEDIARISAVLPATELVRADQGEDLWARRKGLFFKPVSGYGGKAVYRGMNVTKGVFANILAGDYVAQTLAPPPSRTVVVDGQPVELKYDLRCYVYDGTIQLMAARLWQGQTTNFRTPGGGFAPVVLV